jgi:6-phosphogluconolactonase
MLSTRMKPLCCYPLLGLVITGVLVDGAHMLSEAANATSKLVYIGTYTGAKSQGIYLARFDESSGELSGTELAAETVNPTFLALSPDRRFLYAANEVGTWQGKPSGAVSAFSIDRSSGKLTLLNQQPSGGAGPCHLAVDKTAKCLLAANYGSGSVAALAIEADGRLKEPACTIQHQGASTNPQRQEGPHAHYITADPGNRFLFCCDLGLDKVLGYRLTPATASLVANDPPSVSAAAGAGPRHLAFHPSGRWVYVINELNSTLSAYEYDGTRGSLKELATVSTLPAEFKGHNSCAEVQVHPSGKFVYGSNRGDDSIAVFSIDSKTGKPTFTGRHPTRGKTPRHFTLDPSGKWLLAENQDSNDIFVFRVNATNGSLEPVGNRTEVGSPVCLVFLQ